MVIHGVAGAMKTIATQYGLYMATKTQTHRSARGHSTKSDHPDETVPREVCDYDYSDDPEWACPREWFIEGRYELDHWTP